MEWTLTTPLTFFFNVSHFLTKMNPHERSEQIDSQISKFTLPNLTNTPLFGNSSFSDKNQYTYTYLNATIDYNKEIW